MPLHSKNVLILTLVAAASAAGFGAGVAVASSNDETVSAAVADANVSLSKGNAKLSAADAISSPPSACISPKHTPAACAAVYYLDVAHAEGLGALQNVDAIETGQGSAPVERRLDRLAWTAEHTRTVFSGIISPELAGIISPEFAGIISPEFAGIISPEVAAELEVAAGIISPELSGIISPEVTAEVTGIISPEYTGIISPERARIENELGWIAYRAQADLVLAYAVKRALDAGNVK
jgi:hypothetical protein